MVEQANTRQKVLIDQLREMFKTVHKSGSQTNLASSRKSQDQIIKGKKHSFVNQTNQNSDIKNLFKPTSSSAIKAGLVNSQTSANIFKTNQHLNLSKQKKSVTGNNNNNISNLLNQSHSNLNLNSTLTNMQKYEYRTEVKKTKSSSKANQFLNSSVHKANNSTNKQSMSKIKITSKLKDNLNLTQSELNISKNDTRHKNNSKMPLKEKKPYMTTSSSAVMQLALPKTLSKKNSMEFKKSLYK